MTGLHRMVAGVMRRVGEEMIMPRFRTLSADQVAEKSPGDLVTVADHEAEALLGEELMRIVPGSQVIGEEAVSQGLCTLANLTRGAAWIVDPLDGTGNFAAGETPFACMVALAVDGVVEAGWVLDPSSGRMCHAQRGGGAFINDEPVTARGSGASTPIGALLTRFLPSALHAPVLARAEGRIETVPIPRCAGEQYPRLVLGANDLALFWNINPWDHAPGVLFLQEAGGHAARLDGAPYRLGDEGFGLLAAASPALWAKGAEVLLAEPLPPV